MSDAAQRLATAADLLKLGDASAEVIHGIVTYKAEPSTEHADAQLGVAAFLRQLTEVDVELAVHEVVRPDVAGWRRERVVARPGGRPVRTRQDWVCEVLSESNAATDQVDEFRLYGESRIPFYWIADPTRKILTVYRLDGESYSVALQAKQGETVHAPPFDAVALRVGLLFGEDPG